MHHHLPVAHLSETVNSQLNNLSLLKDILNRNLNDNTAVNWRFHDPRRRDKEQRVAFGNFSDRLMLNRLSEWLSIVCGLATMNHLVVFAVQQTRIIWEWNRIECGGTQTRNVREISLGFTKSGAVRLTSNTKMLAFGRFQATLPFSSQGCWTLSISGLFIGKAEPPTRRGGSRRESGE